LKTEIWHLLACIAVSLQSDLILPELAVQHQFQRWIAFQQLADRILANTDSMLCVLF